MHIPFPNPPPGPLQPPERMLVYLAYTPNFLQHRIFHADLRARPDGGVSRGWTSVALPGVLTPCLDQGLTGRSCGAGWVFRAEIPEASAPAPTLCHDTHCHSHFCSGWCLTPLSSLQAKPSCLLPTALQHLAQQSVQERARTAGSGAGAELRQREG